MTRAIVSRLRRNARMVLIGLAGAFALSAAFALSGAAMAAPPPPMSGDSHPIAADQLDSQGVPLHPGSGFVDKAASLHSVEWKLHEIPVCWLNPAPADEASRIAVRESVHEVWETSANIRMVGWAPCRGRENSVRIIVSDEEWPRAMVGTQAMSRSRPTVWLNFHLDAKPSFANCVPMKDRCLRFTAVHEFGHMLGLIHEQDRPDTPSECINRLASGQRQERHDSDLDLLTGYDPDSLMNYCSARGYNPNVPLVLSDEDHIAIRKLFGDQNQPGIADSATHGSARPRNTTGTVSAAAPAAGGVATPDGTANDPPPQPKHPDRPVFDPN